jgi:Mg2+-importing ATPase
MGDGINDAPALRAADIGISVDTATDIAKESADLILLEKDLMVLQEGVIEGRKVFANILKYIRMGASSNFGNMFSVLGASAFLPYIPMAPIQVLTNNLLYDFSQIPIPIDAVDAEQVARPRPWKSSASSCSSAPSAQSSITRRSSSCSGSSIVGTHPVPAYFKPAGSSNRS